MIERHALQTRAIVDKPEEYRYSSAKDYYSKKKGYLAVEII